MATVHGVTKSQTQLSDFTFNHSQDFRCRWLLPVSVVDRTRGLTRTELECIKSLMWLFTCMQNVKETASL